MRKLSRREFIVVGAGGAALAYVGASCAGEDEGGGSPTSAPSAAVPAGSPTVDAGTDAGAVGLQWFGQSMFLMTSPAGATVLLDPFGQIGYTVPPPLNTDAATITHEHPDHNNASLGGTATLLRGLTADGWADIDESVGDIRVLTVPTYHDASQGSERGRNAVFVFETAGLRFAHLGDLGHTLSEQQIAQIGPVDALMVPVGGGFTLDGAGATEVTNQLAPKIVFPMHYKTEKLAFSIATADAFLAGKAVERVGATTLRISTDTLPAGLTAYVLDYE